MNFEHAIESLRGSNHNYITMEDIMSLAEDIPTIKQDVASCMGVTIKELGVIIIAKKLLKEDLFHAMGWGL